MPSSAGSGLIISGVSERDLDLLLLEELVASAAFRDLIAHKAGCPAGPVTESFGVQRSVTHSAGESDLELRLGFSDGQAVTVLIENKVDAAFQPAQADRYRLRGAQLVAAGACSAFRTLLVAPATYLGTSSTTLGFDAVLSYEAIDSWFESQTQLGERVRYKRALLRAAIERSTLGYQAVADAQVTAFWKRYRERVNELAPELNMPLPKGKPAGSTFIRFKPDDFPKELDLIHKFRHGRVDLEFSGWGSRLAALREELMSIDWEGAELVPAAKSACLRWFVPKIGVGIDDPGHARLKEGIARAAATLRWYRQHSEVLSQILAK